MSQETDECAAARVVGLLHRTHQRSNIIASWLIQRPRVLLTVGAAATDFTLSPPANPSYTHRPSHTHPSLPSYRTLSASVIHHRSGPPRAALSSYTNV